MVLRDAGMVRGFGSTFVADLHESGVARDVRKHTLVTVSRLVRRCARVELG
jgi:hypothetical protein